MKRAKALVIAEQTAPQIVPCEPSYMLCLESSDGHRFLVDRNCAVVSGVIRRMLQNNHSDFDDTSSNRVATNGGGATLATACQVPATPTIFETATFESSETSSVCSEGCATPLGGFASSTVHGGGVAMTTKVGSLEYEVIKLDEIPGDLLDLALQEMYYKYRGKERSFNTVIGDVKWVSGREGREEHVNGVEEAYSDEDDRSTDDESSVDEQEDEDTQDISDDLVATFSGVLARDLEIQKGRHQHMEGCGGDADRGNVVAGDQLTASNATERVCCICKERSIYTCPRCGARTCSIICVRVHKKQFDCNGERDVAKKIPLSEFTDKQFERDFHFLEDTRRVVSNCERTFPRMWRYTFRALPPPLYALRKAAKQRGVVCQITSEGMAKRDANTSRFDRRTETIIWRCQFNFHCPDFTVSTDWGNERHKLGDILTYCWSTNPPINCFHINRRYNRASKWIGVEEEKDPQHDVQGTKGGDGEEVMEAGGSDEGESGGNEVLEVRCVSSSVLPADGGGEKEGCAEGDDTERPTFVDTEGKEFRQTLWKPSALDVTPQSAEEANGKRAVTAFLLMSPTIILARAERLGLERKYFRLSPSQTLNEALRALFFINEFPVFEVIHASDLESYPLVTESDKERIRESFRATPRPPKPERPPRPTKSTLTPEERERYAQVPCRLFLAGCCRLGEEECPYRHCEYRDVPACRSFMKFASCEKGNSCVFRHDAAAVAAERKRMRDERQTDGQNRRCRRKN